MVKVMGVVGILIGLAVGLYVGAWVLFIGGVIQVYDAFTAQEIVLKSELAWGLFKMIIAQPVGVICAYVFILPGVATLLDD
jgi:hypothetical protein